MSISQLSYVLFVASRATMVGFSMRYVVDALTGLDVVGQTTNFICKAALFFTIIGVIIIRRTQDFKNIKN